MSIAMISARSKTTETYVPQLVKLLILMIYIYGISFHFCVYLGNKTFSVPSQPGENRGEHLGEFESRSVKTRDAVEGFHLLENSHKHCRGFQQAMKERTTCFISVVKLFSLLTKRKTIYCKFSQLGNSQTISPPLKPRKLRNLQNFKIIIYLTIII